MLSDLQAQTVRLPTYELKRQPYPVMVQYVQRSSRRSHQEQGLLAQVSRADRPKEPVIVLGWEPHPMNANFKITYLAGGEDFFGPNLSGTSDNIGPHLASA